MTGNALKRARAFLGYTQEQMATACGLSLATYQRREALAEEYVPIAEATHVRELTREAALRVLDMAEEAEYVPGEDLNLREPTSNPNEESAR